MQSQLGVPAPTVARKIEGELEIVVQPGNPVIYTDAEAAQLADETDNSALSDAIKAVLADKPTPPVVGRE